MEITINEKTIKLKKTFRSLIAYEQATGGMFSPKTISETIMYFYCVIIASDKDVDIDYDEFMDWLDENPSSLQEFSNWIVKQNEQEEMLTKKKTQKKRTTQNQ